jgi:aldose 1-epimerase
LNITELATRNARVRIAPDLGGAIVSFRFRDRAILRETPQAALAARNVRGAACYPLVPYSNRIRDARLRFGGRTFALARNFGTHPHAIHGVGWQRAWSLDEATSQRARLRLEHCAQGDDALAWPWPFHATQAFSLVESIEGAKMPSAQLVVTLTLANSGVEPFPFGLGFHPFFVRDAATKLSFRAGRVWRNDATQLPQRLVDIPRAWRFDRPRAVTVALDNVFVGWRGTASIREPSAATVATLAADSACARLVVYAPPDATFIAIEPVTHDTDAFNRAADGAAGTGVRVLAPGTAFSCTMRVAVATTA